MDEKPWKNRELRSVEEALQKLKECHLEEVSRLYEAKTGAGCDGFHPEVTLDLTKAREDKPWRSRVAATSMHDDVLLDSEECHE